LALKYQAIIRLVVELRTSISETLIITLHFGAFIFRENYTYRNTV
jgi:hypothetical protein